MDAPLRHMDRACPDEPIIACLLVQGALVKRYVLNCNIKTPLARSRHFSPLSCENNIQDLYKSPEYAKVTNNSTKIRKLVTLLHVKIYLYYTN